jgi:poly(A) polymerase
MRLDPAEWLDRPGIKRLLKALDAKDGHARFVGGAIRDFLLDQHPDDLDLATDLLPDEVTRRLVEAGIKVVPTGIDHGTVTAISSGTIVEVTSLRADVSTDGRRATVEFTDDWSKDAGRRDFTINALYADPFTGELFDFHGGIADLKARTVRFIGEPLQRIAEDHLRILRYFRFHARYGHGEPDSDALDACTERANDLMALSRERIADELLKLLSLVDPTPTVRLMAERNIFRPIIPEIGDEGVARLARLIETEGRAGLAPDPVRRLAALLDGPPDLGRAIAARLKFSNRNKKRLELALKPAAGAHRAQAYRDGSEAAIDRIAIGVDLSADEQLAALRDLAAWPVPRLPIGGGQLIARGVTEGPDVARTMRRIEDAWEAAGFPDGDAFERIVEQALR